MVDNPTEEQRAFMRLGHMAKAIADAEEVNDNMVGLINEATDVACKQNLVF